MKPQIHDKRCDDDGHTWMVCRNSCDLRDVSDPTLLHMVQAVRDAYGESEITSVVDEMSKLADADVANRFDIEAIIKGFRSSLPNPQDETSKPQNLRTYRSETAEFFAREVLRMFSDVTTPPTLHACKGNALQPLLGYDGWGISGMAAGSPKLVLIQVKGSDEAKSPPAVVNELLEECLRIPLEHNKLCRALSACLLRTQSHPVAPHVALMLQSLGKNQSIHTVVAPVIVRGAVSAEMSDLAPLQCDQLKSSGSSVIAITAAVGAPLEEFGRVVMMMARDAA